MTIDPNIKQKAEDIRKKIFGSEVRESLASGLEGMSEDVESIKGRQDTVEDTFQTVIEETTGKDVISAPEIIAARGGHDNLSQRLLSTDQQLQQTEQELTAQLSQTGENLKKTTVLDNTTEENSINAFRDVNVPDKTTVTIFEAQSAPHSFFPSIVKTNNGKLLAFYRKGNGHGVDTRSKIYLKESSDKGVTWTNERVVVDNTGFDPRDPDVLLTDTGDILLKWFDHDGTNVYSKVKRSADNGDTFGNEIVLPNPPDYTENKIATKGKFIQVNGVFYASLYTVDNKAYLVQSENGTSWTFVSYIDKYITLNETSLCYVENEKALYAISRQGKGTQENVLFPDYANKLFLSKSFDFGKTWKEQYELPIYGHAPSAVSYNGEIYLTYKNTYIRANNNRYTLDFVKLRNGKLNGYPKTLSFATGVNAFDVFYSDILIDNDYCYIILYTFNEGYSKIAVHKIQVSELEKLSFAPYNSLGISGWRFGQDGVIEAWKDSDINLTLQPNEMRVINLTNIIPFKKRPLTIHTYIADAFEDEKTDKIIVSSRILDAEGRIRVTLWNTNDTSVSVFRIKTFTVGI